LACSRSTAGAGGSTHRPGPVAGEDVTKVERIEWVESVGAAATTGLGARRSYKWWPAFRTLFAPKTC
jgi:hypothetical protein